MVWRQAMRAFKLVKKADILLLLFWGLLGLGLFFSSIYGIMGAASEGRLTIICGNEVCGVYKLTEDRTIEIGDGNTCEIRNGKVSMISADCPDKLCVRSREISAVGESIVCLPNHVILKITGEAEDTVMDAISE